MKALSATKFENKVSIFKESSPKSNFHSNEIVKTSYRSITISEINDLLKWAFLQK
jgi:hypothetical protein